MISGTGIVMKLMLLFVLYYVWFAAKVTSQFGLIVENNILKVETARANFLY